MTKLLQFSNEMQERAHHFAVKIEATAGREMNTHVKVGKNSGTTHSLTRLGPISIDENGSVAAFRERKKRVLWIFGKG